MDTERNRAWWRSRRGLLELDLVLLPFVESRWPTLTAAQRTAYRALIEADDQDIWSWISTGAAPSPELEEIVEVIVAFLAQRAER
jgi:antitoxin CptB